MYCDTLKQRISHRHRILSKPASRIAVEMMRLKTAENRTVTDGIGNKQLLWKKEMSEDMNTVSSVVLILVAERNGEFMNENSKKLGRIMA